ncbi:MAG: hypothetical protein ACHRHE_15310 [Tepidisphaerales bacterium]
MEILKHRKSHVRFSALCCLGMGTPANVVDEMLRAGLSDRSASVRWKAAEKATTLNRKNLIPEMTAALTAETNAKARREIEFELRLLRDGYILKPASPSGFNVTVPIKNGTCGHWVSEDEMRAKGLDAILSDMRNDQPL